MLELLYTRKARATKDLPLRPHAGRGDDLELGLVEQHAELKDFL